MLSATTTNAVKPDIHLPPEFLPEAQCSWTLQPLVSVDLDAVVKVSLKHADSGFGKSSVIDGLIRFQIPSEIPAVKITRTN